MKAVFADKNNKGQLTYADVPKPKLKRNRVLIEIHAACINPVDWKTLGQMQSLFKLGLPLPNMVAGFDLSGVVVGVGENISNIKVGDEVYAMSPVPGSYAEYISIRSVFVLPKPKNLSFSEAAACPMAALTAYQAFRNIKLQAGEKVLVIGASGGVGSFAVQIAKAIGANVTGVCSTANVDLVKSLGVDRVVDYKKDNLRDDKDLYDVIYDCVGNESIKSCSNILSNNGRFVSIANSSQNRKEIAMSYLRMLVGQDKRKARTLLALPLKSHLTKITELLEQRKIRPVIDSTFPLADTVNAHIHSQTGRAKGKIVIAVK